MIDNLKYLGFTRTSPLMGDFLQSAIYKLKYSFWLLDIHSQIWFTLLSTSLLKAFYPPATKTIEIWFWQASSALRILGGSNVILIANGCLNCPDFYFHAWKNLISQIIFISPSKTMVLSFQNSKVNWKIVPIYHPGLYNQWFIWRSLSRLLSSGGRRNIFSSPTANVRCV